jgi:hypothetical protein
MQPCSLVTACVGGAPCDVHMDRGPCRAFNLRPLQTPQRLQSSWPILAGNRVGMSTCDTTTHGRLQEELRDMIMQLLAMKAPLLRDRWAITVTAGGRHLLTLPQLITGYAPDMDSLPEFLISLAVDVNWDDEAACLVDIAKVLRLPSCLRLLF